MYSRRACSQCSSSSPVLTCSTSTGSRMCHLDDSSSKGTSQAIWKTSSATKRSTHAPVRSWALARYRRYNSSACSFSASQAIAASSGLESGWEMDPRTAGPSGRSLPIPARASRVGHRHDRSSSRAVPGGSERNGRLVEALGVAVRRFLQGLGEVQQQQVFLDLLVDRVHPVSDGPDTRLAQLVRSRLTGSEIQQELDGPATGRARVG